jgi:tetratricopeptide (TPR) repeat protein
VEDLIALAIQRNLAHAPAWDLIVELRKKDRLHVDRLDRFFDVLLSKTASKYPDFMYLTVMRTVPTIADADRRERIYKRVMEVYLPAAGGQDGGKRPDLYGRVLIAVGDDYRGQGRKDAALQAYRQAATKCAQVAEIVVQAAQRAEDVYNEAKRPDLAIELYRQLFNSVKKDDGAGIFRNQTSHYQLGQRLAALLKAAGQADSA